MRKIIVELTDTLARRVRNAAIEDFESIESFIPVLLNRALSDRRRRRRGGKPPARKLLRPVPPNYKRGRILDWFCTAPEPTVSAAAIHFRMTRRAVLMTLGALHTYHGIGYGLDGATDRVTILLPKGSHRDS